MNTEINARAALTRLLLNHGDFTSNRAPNYGVSLLAKLALDHTSTERGAPGIGMDQEARIAILTAAHFAMFNKVFP